MTRGRRTKLTPEVQAKIVDLIERGFTLTAAAHHAGIGKATIFYWLRRAERNGSPELLDFLASVRAALEKRKEVHIKANPRRFARARYEKNMSHDQIVANLTKELDRLITEGRVPWNAALVALGMMADEIRDKLYDESYSWDESMTPAFGNTRARMEDDDE